jgi:hypothetical protein
MRAIAAYFVALATSGARQSKQGLTAAPNRSQGPVAADNSFKADTIRGGNLQRQEFLPVAATKRAGFIQGQVSYGKVS